MGMYRDGRDRPTFDTEAIIIREETGVAEQRGRGRNPHAYMTLLSDSDTRPAGPTSPPPTSGRAAPNPIGSWKAWWPTPQAGDSTYQMPEPPDIDLPDYPDIDMPFVWSVKGRVGANSTWELPEIRAIHVMADKKDIRGREVLLDRSMVQQDQVSLMIQRASIEMILNEVSSVPFAKRWSILLNRVKYTMEAAMESQDGRLYRLVAENQG